MLAAALLLLSPGSILDVGDGKPFARIEDAVKVAHSNDEIHVFPKLGGYPRSAVLVRTSGLKIVGEERITLDGSNFDYSGVGSIPRAIFQVDSGADGVTIENFELLGAHNASHNGAGIRINAGNHCTIRNCTIHDNDMGIMSSGVVGDQRAGSDQLIDHSEIYKNGSFAEPGYNHNLYLGGTSVTVQFCDIHDSLTGHNLKSRAHFIVVQYCKIHDSSNRELDFVESWDTDRPNSNVLLLGNSIKKGEDSKGNRTVIHFGQERGRRDGTIFLVNNEITTPFMSPIVDLTAPSASVRLFNNVIVKLTEAHPVFVGVQNGALLSNVAGSSNVLSSNYLIAGTRIDTQTLYTDVKPPFKFVPLRATYVDGDGRRHSVKPEFYLDDKQQWKPATVPFIGVGSVVL